MKRNKWVKGLCLAILVAAVGGGSLAYAKKSENSSHSALKDGDQIQSHNQRQKMQLSVRRQAAKRLKKLHVQAREQHLKHEIESHGKRGNQ